MPVVISGAIRKSQFEIAEFDASPATLAFSPLSLNKFFGQPINLTHADIRDISGAPSGATVRYDVVNGWGNTGADRPLPGLYFFVSHPSIIEGENTIGICHSKQGGYSVYIKDIFFNDLAASGVAALSFARMVRFCLRLGINKIRLLAAGGRSWPDILYTNGTSAGRWGGYYFWARCGFDMPLLPSDIAFIPNFVYPPHLSSCNNVRSVVKNKGGLEWWKVCGNGDFMEFDCSSVTNSSIVALESYLAEKGI